MVVDRALGMGLPGVALPCAVRARSAAAATADMTTYKFTGCGLLQDRPRTQGAVHCLQ